MQIAEATIHHLTKEAHTQGEGAVKLQLRENNLPIDDTLSTVCKDLLGLYNRTTDSQGTFGADENVHIFPRRLEEYLEGTLDLGGLTAAAIRLIGAQMEASRLASGGYALFVRYEEPPHDFLLIAMLKLKAGAAIDEESLELLPTLNIDLGLLNEAARINITRLRDGAEPYLTFIKGTRKKTEITAYFRTALACTQFTLAAEQTKELIAAADEYTSQRDDLVTPDAQQRERHAMRGRLYNCLRDNSQEVSLATAAAYIHPDAPEEFISFVQAVDQGDRRYKFNDRFRPHKDVVKSLKQIGSKFGTVKVSFAVSDVQSGAVSYDLSSNSLKILNPPEELRREVLEYQSDAPE
jgi:nucleoid-associated protein